MAAICLGLNVLRVNELCLYVVIYDKACFGLVYNLVPTCTRNYADTFSTNIHHVKTRLVQQYITSIVYILHVLLYFVV